MGYLRLRQLCFVARDLAPAQGAFERHYGLKPAYSDPHVAEFGLTNILLPLGPQPLFLEIVAPVRDGTTAGRYLDRRGGDGGYMVICDTDDLAAARARAAAAGVRIIRDHDLPPPMGAAAIQLHPGDSGGAILEFDRHEAGVDMRGAYRWAGPDWHKALTAQGPVTAVLGVEVQSDGPDMLAARWAQLFGRPIVVNGGIAEIRLDNGFIRFPPARDGRGPGLSAVHLAVREGGPAETGICGVRFFHHPA